MDLIDADNGITFNNFIIQIGFMHIHGCDLAVFVGGVIVDPAVSIAATGIHRPLQAISGTGAAIGLRHRV